MHLFLAKDSLMVQKNQKWLFPQDFLAADSVDSTICVWGVVCELANLGAASVGAIGQRYALWVFVDHISILLLL